MPFFISININKKSKVKQLLLLVQINSKFFFIEI